MPTEETLLRLKAPFPESLISWRAQTLTRDGSKALALAYIDARDVMNRLDEVVGAANWQDSYVVDGVRTICTLSIRYGGEWVSKSDGAGDTSVEAEKGSISDAFKRAAVKWGVGRYLYDIAAPWVPCEVYENSQGKKVFSSWKVDPWKYVKGDVGSPSTIKEDNAGEDVKNFEKNWATPQLAAPATKEPPYKRAIKVIEAAKTIEDVEKAYKYYVDEYWEAASKEENDELHNAYTLTKLRFDGKVA